MSDESTTPDLDTRVLRGFEATSTGDLDLALQGLAADAAVDMARTTGIVTQGGEAFRTFEDDWLVGYEEFAQSRGFLTARSMLVYEWRDDTTVCVVACADTDDARAATERLAEERG